MAVLPLSFIQCKKLDLCQTPHFLQTDTDSLSPVLEKFFDTSKVSNAMINSIARKIYRQEKEKPFVEKFVKYAGLPVWIKSMIFKAKPVSTIATRSGRKDSSSNIAFIPLSIVRDSTLHAILRVSITVQDTTFNMLYRWQYKRKGYEKKEGVNNARQTALLFMRLENVVYGNKVFKINDSLLFRRNDSTINYIHIDNFNSGQDNDRLALIAIQTCYTEIGPYWDYGAGAGLFIDTAKYLAPYEGSIGTLWHLDPGSLPGADGSVIESGYTQYNSSGYQSNYFTVSTMETPLDFEHPVAGNRRFGIYSDPDHPGEFVFYTMGVDRIWDDTFAFGNWFGGRATKESGFDAADDLWSSLQEGMIQFIQGNEGTSSYYSNHNSIARPKWKDVEKYLKEDFDFIELKRRLRC